MSRKLDRSGHGDASQSSDTGMRDLGDQCVSMARMKKTAHLGAGLAGVNLHTWAGGAPSHTGMLSWRTLRCTGRDLLRSAAQRPAQFPVAARAGFGNIRNNPDLITSKLAALHFYQLAIPAPTAQVRTSYQGPQSIREIFGAPPQTSERGEAIFEGKAKCASCHVPPLFTEPGWNMHTAAEIGIDDFQANRAPDRRYRTAPLKGLWTHQKGGFYHDGRFATLRDVVEHYDRFFNLGLRDQDKKDLVEYLLSL